MEEPSLPMDVEKLLEDLHAPDFRTKKEAIEGLGQMPVSNVRVVEALMRVREEEEWLSLREVAHKALLSLPHQTVIQQYPDLKQRQEQAEEQYAKRQAEARRQENRTVTSPIPTSETATKGKAAWKELASNGLLMLVGGSIVSIIGFAVVYWELQNGNKYHVMYLLGAWAALLVAVVGVPILLLGLIRQGTLGKIGAIGLGVVSLVAGVIIIIIFYPFLVAFASLIPGALKIFGIAVFIGLAGWIFRLYNR